MQGKITDYLTIVMPDIESKDEDQRELDIIDDLLRPRIESTRIVTQYSHVSYRKALQRMAGYLRREMRYDFIPYAWNEEIDRTVKPWIGYLFMVDEYSPTVCGGCQFRWRAWQDAKPGYELCWVWLHPYMRRKGRLTDAWQEFKKYFGRFSIDQPGKAMRDFLNKHEPKFWEDGIVSEPAAVEIYKWIEL